LSVALIDAKKRVRVATNSACVSLLRAVSSRWFAHALLHARA
jgi:hypothetical protein